MNCQPSLQQRLVDPPNAVALERKAEVYARARPPVHELRVLTQFWCSLGTCGTLAGIDEESVISRKPLPRSEQGNASPRVQDRPGLGHGG